VYHEHQASPRCDACRDVGVPRSSFYDICKRNPEAVAKIQEIIEANAQQQLGLILSHKTSILRKVISDGLADTTKPKDRLAIYKALGESLDGLTQSLEIDSQTPLCQEHGRQLEMKEVVMLDHVATKLAPPDHCWVCEE